MFYRKNIAGWERVLRVCVGIVTMAFGVWGMPVSLVSYVVMASGCIALLTGFVGFCPMCAMVGRTLDENKEKHE